MPNPFFNNTNDLLPTTRARASDVEANFSAVGAGFDLVKVELDKKAPLESPAFTNNPTVPTPALGDTTERIANMAAVQAAINNAAAINLPTVAGAAGRSLTVVGGAPIWADLSLTNLVHSGNFQINERGVTGTVVLAAGAYGHDRWKAGISGCTYTFSTSAGITTVTISSGTLLQVIEGKDIRGGSYVASWSGTAQGRINSGAYSASGITATLVGGVDATIEFGTGSLSLVQLEIGTQSTSPIVRPHAIESQICKRYLPVTNVSHISGQSYGVGVAYFHTNFCVEARVKPTDILLTATLSSYLVTNPSFSYTAMTGGAVLFGIAEVGGGSFTAAPASSIWGAGGQATSFRLSSGAKILWTGAEL